MATKRKYVSWWKSKIKQLRETNNHIRCVYTWKRKRLGKNACVPEKEALRQEKLELTMAIKKSKEEPWRELCRKVESDPWDKSYKLVMGKHCKKSPIPGNDTPGKKLPTYKCKMLDNYFHERRLTHETADKKEMKKLSVGVPQGLVVGPTMWAF